MPDRPVPPLPDPALIALAALYGVAARYDNYCGDPQTVSATTIREVLAVMDVDASTAESVRAAIDAAQTGLWRRLVPPSIVVRATGPIVVPVRVPAGESAHISLRLETGGTQDSQPQPGDGRGAVVDGRRVVEHDVSLGDLPMGYHELMVTAGGRTDSCVLIVAPERIPWPRNTGRVEGWMTQLYAVRSLRSWGIGDLTDLATLASWSGRELGFGAVLINPLHAAAPVDPMQRSPYFPSSKRFVNPLYLDPDAVPERQSLTGEPAELFERFGVAARAAGPELIDRDAVWAAKVGALALLHAQPRDDADAYNAYLASEGSALADFATFCVLAELHGPQWPSWPAELHDPGSPHVETVAREYADRVDFFCWLQFLCGQQRRAAQQVARDAGMAIGVIHDLAVGVDPGGADSWSMRGDLAFGVSIGTPPDLYAKQGQNWSQPPLRPDRLRVTGYAVFRDMLRSVLRGGGGIRIDHILGLFRLWWIPPGRTAAEGTYVSYPIEEMLGVLALEATRADAIVVGEDLGTMPAGTREALHANGILGSAVLYFERDHEGPVAPSRWAASSLATINTHDLSTAVGHLTNQRVPLYRSLGLLDDEQAASEARQAEIERDQLVRYMVDAGVVAADATVEDQVVGMHVLLASSPCQLVLSSLSDAVFDPRQPNVPGTTDEQHPNWCLPLATVVEGKPVPILLDDLPGHDGVRRVVAALRGERNTWQR